MEDMTPTSHEWQRLHTNKDCGAMRHAGIALTMHGAWFWGYADTVYAITRSTRWVEAQMATYSRVCRAYAREVDFYKLAERHHAPTN